MATYTAEELAEFARRAAARDTVGRNYPELFPNGDRLTLELLNDGEKLQTIDERLAAIIAEYNKNPRNGITVARDQKMIVQYQGGKKLSRDKSIANFLKEMDTAEAWLLRHDWEMENGNNTISTTEAVTELGTAIQLSEISHHNDVSNIDFRDLSNLHVVISRDAMDIAKMSADRRWKSCMSKEGCNHRFVPEEIEAGTIVAYLVHKDDSDIEYPLMRVLLKPYLNEKGEAILVPNFVYPAYQTGNSGTTSALLYTVRQFAIGYNDGKTGTFKMDTSKIYSDGQETSATLGEQIQTTEELAQAIAGAIPEKTREYITEIETAYQHKEKTLYKLIGARGDAQKEYEAQAQHYQNHMEIYTRKLASMYNPDINVATIAYLRNLREVNIGQQMPKPSDVATAMQSHAVIKAKSEYDIIAHIYIKGEKKFAAYMQQHHSDCTSFDAKATPTSSGLLGDYGLKTLASYGANLTELDLSHCYEITDKAVRKVAESFNNLTTLNLVACHNIGRSGLHSLSKNCKNLVKLDLSVRRVEGDIPAFAKNCSELTQLKMSKCWGVTDEEVKILAKNCPKLIELDLSECPSLTDAAFDAFGANWPNLTRLNLSQCDIRDKGVELLAKNLPNLTQLNLSNCAWLTNESVKALAKNCPNLEKLSLKGCSSLTDEGVRTLAESCRKIRDLDINNCHKITQNILQALAINCRDLTALELPLSVGMSDVSIEILAANCPNLIQLIISYTNISSDQSFSERLQENKSNAERYLAVLRETDIHEISAEDRSKILERAAAIADVSKNNPAILQKLQDLKAPASAQSSLGAVRKTTIPDTSPD